MDISSRYEEQISSVQQAISTTNLQTAMNQDAEAVDTLLEGLEESNEAISRAELEKAVTPHKGQNIDITL
ncbi:putative motility protein [Natroniella sulfidigena]|uniref:putative motility protein n=1 Tax=Natroniella sulfidigena TaxID=723921 RepID=UPI00200B1278|nr:putative motility protein [Natroniella sulfidigena]MCK8816862.1 putative motility protein [Natroniella sulfidigena]